MDSFKADSAKADINGTYSKTITVNEANWRSSRMNGESVPFSGDAITIARANKG